MASIERLGESEDGRKRPHDVALPRAERSEAFVLFPRRTLAVIPRDEPDDLGFLWLEATKIAVLDQVIRVLVMSRIADVCADVVEQRGAFGHRAAIRQPVNASGLVEDGEREPRDLQECSAQ
jgi:hypothetical protein